MFTDKRHPLIRSYAGLLRLYPADFRGEFADEMLAAFEETLRERGALYASFVVSFELFPTLLREHMDSNGARGLRVLRLFACVFLPLALYVASLAKSSQL